MFFGSRSAQTSNESAQNSNAGGGGIDDGVGARITALIHSNTPCNLHHMWRKLGRDAGILSPHHSQLFVTDRRNGFILFNFGLWCNDRGQVEFAMDERIQHYTQSKTYSPNPIPVTPQQLMNAFVATRQQCGPEYKLLHNNCQKFGRLFMTNLGAKHTRSLFHP